MVEERNEIDLFFSFFFEMAKSGLGNKLQFHVDMAIGLCASNKKK